MSMTLSFLPLSPPPPPHTHTYEHIHTQNPSERLGCHPQTGFQDIVSHAFYRTIEWELVSQATA